MRVGNLGNRAALILDIGAIDVAEASGGQFSLGKSFPGFGPMDPWLVTTDEFKNPDAIPNGLGKHDNDKMFSFHTMTPAGFQVEVGYGAFEVGPDWDENRAYDSISMWGHYPLTREA